MESVVALYARSVSATVADADGRCAHSGGGWDVVVAVTNAATATTDVVSLHSFANVVLCCVIVRFVKFS